MGYYFSDENSNSLVSSIHDIEILTQGEIRIHIEDLCEDDPIDRAVEVFNALEMYKTEEKTGVLIYLAVEDKKAAIIGDAGIDEKVNNDFWDVVLIEMEKCFSEENYLDGLKIALDMVGKQLIKYFPKKKGNQNELPNEISYGKV